PSSFHSFGSSQMEVIETARGQVARLLGAKREEIYFTSGGTESDNHALRGAVKMSSSRRGIVISAVEHPAVLDTARVLAKEGYPLEIAAVDANGELDLSNLQELVNTKTAIVSIMAANNETGVVMPLKESAEIAHRSGALFHTDAVQMVGKVPIDVHSLEIDMLSLSAHKLHGPKGVGAIYIRKGIQLPPVLTGGHQENGFRSGTYNTPGIAGLGKAAELALTHLDDTAVRERALRESFEKKVVDSCPGSFVVSERAAHRLPGTVTIIFRGIESEAVLTLLDMQGVYASSGSACSTGSKNSSHVLTAMGVDFNLSNSALRFSLSRYTTQEELDHTVKLLASIVERLRRISPYAE
ncbi:MAG: aminotransferase class V-fold PLP-dependent enzyme, partial [Candidatus Fermentibacteraceae bacterium]|nr:aminotransferase class V-fold PLP-dependent enzyme [Candidatus Fermentibacteraceae bacterium]